MTDPTLKRVQELEKFSATLTDTLASYQRQFYEARDKLVAARQLLEGCVFETDGFTMPLPESLCAAISDWVNEAAALRSPEGNATSDSE